MAWWASRSSEAAQRHALAGPISSGVGSAAVVVAAAEGADLREAASVPPVTSVGRYAPPGAGSVGSAQAVVAPVRAEEPAQGAARAPGAAG